MAILGAANEIVTWSQNIKMVSSNTLQRSDHSIGIISIMVVKLNSQHILLLWNIPCCEVDEICLCPEEDLLCQLIWIWSSPAC